MFCNTNHIVPPALVVNVDSGGDHILLFFSHPRGLSPGGGRRGSIIPNDLDPRLRGDDQTEQEISSTSEH